MSVQDSKEFPMQSMLPDMYVNEQRIRSFTDTIKNDKFNAQVLFIVYQDVQGITMVHSTTRSKAITSEIWQGCNNIAL